MRHERRWKALSAASDVWTTIDLGTKVHEHMKQNNQPIPLRIQENSYSGSPSVPSPWQPGNGTHRSFQLDPTDPNSTELTNRVPTRPGHASSADRGATWPAPWGIPFRHLDAVTHLTALEIWSVMLGSISTRISDEGCCWSAR